MLGFLAGLRTFTAPAVLWLMRPASPLGYVLGALAVLEYAGDLHPKAPPRTAPLGLIARACSGAFCGWTVTSGAGAPVAAGLLLGALAAVVGAYAGLAARTFAIARAGRVPAALLEDAVAIAASIAVVAYL
ncbi:MAG TPA: hypothetical protein VHX17_05365 [Candidatus Cybelea sp.]|nr:hypothetical protein [Candidatus Cybelea sp.]